MHSLNVLLVAEESAGVKMLRALDQGNCRLVAVMAAPSHDDGTSVWDVARSLGYETWPAREVTQPAIAAAIRDRAVDLLLNVHSLYVVCPEVLAMPRLGCYNLHPGPLPEYAGLNVVSWAIHRGARRHAVTVHRMLPGIDDGPIAYETSFAIMPDETALSLSLKCVREGLPLLQRLLDQACLDPAGIPSREQDLSRRRYFRREVPDGGWLDWTRPARNVYDFIRACDYFPFASPWGLAKTECEGREIEIAKAKLTGLSCQAPPGTVSVEHPGSVMVACADEVISVQRVRVDGRITDAIGVLRPGTRLRESPMRGLAIGPEAATGRRRTDEGT